MNAQTKSQESLLKEFTPHTYAHWRKSAEESLKGAPFEKKLITKTYEGIDLQPIYSEKDTENLLHLGGFPGFAPFVRGGQASGYRQEPWLICQELPYGTPKEFNSSACQALNQGQTALNLLLDVATRQGVDPDQAKEGQVGMCGLSVASLKDLEQALQNIHLEKTPIFVQAGASALPLLAMLTAHFKKQRKSPASLTGAIEMDPLGEWVRDGSLPVSLEMAFRDMAVITAWACSQAPKFQTISVQSQGYHDAGANAVQELAFALATGVVYLKEMLARGLSIDEVAPQIRFTLSVGSQYFTEIAKLRAVRLLWAKVIQAFGGKESSQRLKIHVRTSLWNKSSCDPYVNVLRATTEAFSAVMGSCDSMHVGAFDEVIRVPDSAAQRLARNTQLILQKECHFDHVVDPAGGSWFVESLTDSLGRKAWALFQEIERLGGMIQVLQEGKPQAWVLQVATEKIAAIGKRKDIMVGVNQYANPSEKSLGSTSVHPSTVFSQRSKQISEYRTSSDHKTETAVLEKLGKLMEATEKSAMEVATEAVLQGATLGEICRTLRSKDMVPTSITALQVNRASKKVEALRLATASRPGGRPKVFLANMGPISQHKLRADFTRGFFSVGGFEVISNKGFTDIESAAKAAIDSGAPVTVICSTDETYPELVPPLVQAIRKTRPKMWIILAGYPTEHVEAFKKTGIDDFIHVRADCVETLEKILKRI